MENKDAINALSEIRDMMAKSSKVLSLSGLSSIVVGIYAVISAIILNYLLTETNFSQPTKNKIIIIGGIILIINSIITVALFAKFKAKKKNLPYKFDLTTKKMLWHFFLPLIVGGILCLMFVMKGTYGYSSTIMLIFYGLSLINLSGYTYSNTKYLGYAELILGFADFAIESHSLLMWTLGFGVGHIVYGILFYIFCEKQK